MSIKSLKKCVPNFKNGYNYVIFNLVGGFNKECLPRLIDDKIEEYLKVYGSISVDEPKWFCITCTSYKHSKSAVYLDITTQLNFKCIIMWNFSFIVKDTESWIYILPIMALKQKK